MVKPASLTVVELRKELKGRGLDTTGLKAVLVARLEEAIKNDGGDGDKKAKKVEEDEEETTTTTTRSTRGRKKRVVEETEESDNEEKEEKPAGRSSKRVAKKKEEDDKEKAEEAKIEASCGKWVQKEGTIFVLDPPSLKGNTKIAGFDMDDTWIETKSGNTHAKSRSDWVWLFPSIPEKLKELHEEGYKIVIFTNQGGIKASSSGSHDASKANAIKGKILDLAQELGFPVQAYISGADDQYRKPSTFMWDLMINEFNKGVKPDLAKCYYVGDAAGRRAGWKAGRKKDFACTDRKFASNIGIAFHTPEEYFLGEAVCTDFEWGGLDVAAFTETSDAKTEEDITEGGIKSLTAKHQEMVVFVGFPASGKSTLAQRYMVPNGYVHVNRDTLKTTAKCIKVAQAAVDDGKSVVIDNTSPAVDTRKEYIDMAKKAGIPVRCFRFDLTEDLAKHLNYYRERMTNGEHKHVSRIGYNIYKKNLVEPNIKEGFSEIKKITFVPILKTDREREEFAKKAGN